ncbi:MAG: DNRLRE domain-containing protein, partial [Frankia sp.]
AAGGNVASLADGDQQLAFGWPGPLPVPTLEKNTATYANVATGTDLLVTVTPTGYDVHLILHTPAAAAAALRLPMQVKDLTASQAPSGEVQLKDILGKVAVRSAVPQMWDAHTDPATGLPDRVTDVPSTLDTTTGATTPTLVLKPDGTWLGAANRQYPITIDPSGTLGDNLDTYVDSAHPTTNYDSNQYLSVGNYLGVTVTRSFLRFNDSSIKGRHVTAASLNMWQVGAGNCAAQPMVVQGSGSLSAGTTWNTQPTADGTNWSNTSFNSGGSCGGSGGTNLDITSLVNAWAGNGFASPDALTLRTPNESDSNQYKYFYSGDTGLAPNITVTYNSYPATVGYRGMSPCSSQCNWSPAVLTNTTTPTLHGQASDADGGNVRLDFEVWDSTGTTRVTYGSVNDVVQNTAGYWTVPSGLLTNGTSYEWRARAYDGTDYSQNWTTWIPFTVDTTAPASPSAVTSTAFPTTGWATATSGTFTWTSPGGDTAGFLYGIDQPSPATATSGTTTATLTPGQGLHTFYIRTKDKAGNLSPVVSYPFAVGSGALAKPADQSVTQRYVTLLGQAPSTQLTVTYRYRFGTSTSIAWTDVPTTDTVIAGTTTHPTWPVGRNGSSLFDPMTWDLNATAVAAGAGDGPVQVEACFVNASNVTTCVTPKTVQLSRHSFTATAATQDFGPGSLALLTGDYSVSAAAAAGGPERRAWRAGSRTATTLAPPAATTGPTGVFGPGWTASIAGPDAGAGDLTLADNTATSGYVTLTADDGSQSVYTATGTGSYPYSYAGVADVGVDGSKLTKDSATQFTYLDGNGTKTIFTAKTVGSSTLWPASQVIEPGSNTTSTFTTDSSGRVTKILGPVPAGVTCTTMVAGCRALTITYATSTTATGSSSNPADWGNYTGQVSSVAMLLNASAAVTVAQYAYDNTGHLRSVTDARTSLTTVYSYLSSGRLATLTPPGLATWTFGYDTGGRLTTISRPDPSGSTATQTVVYDVAVTGTGAPIDLSAGQVAAWAQTDLPVYGAAVFPASHVPAASPTSTDWPYADLTY